MKHSSTRFATPISSPKISYDIQTALFNAICAALAMAGFVGLIVITMFAMAGVQVDFHHSNPAINQAPFSSSDGPLPLAIPPGPEAEVSGTFYEVVAAEFSDAEE